MPEPTRESENRSRLRREFTELASRQRATEVSNIGEVSESETDGMRFAQFEVSVARQSPIERSYYREGLDFSGMDDTFITSGNAPVYWRHDRANNGDMSNIVGTVVSARVEDRDGDKILMATVRFSLDDADSKRCYDKIRAGLIRNVSLGYRPDWAKADKERARPVEWIDDPGGGRETLWYRYWEAREVSFVGLPADESVGLGRDEIKKFKSIIREVERMDNLETVREEETQTRSTSTGGDNPPVFEETETRTETQTETETETETRSLSLSEIKDRVKTNMRDALSDEDIETAVKSARDELNGSRDLNVDDVYREALKIQRARGAEATSQVSGIPQSPYGANVNRDNHNVSCGRLIDEVRSSDNHDLDNLKGMEGEMIQEYLGRMDKYTKRPSDIVRFDAPDGIGPSGNALRLSIPHSMMAMDPAMRGWFLKNLKGDALENYRAAFMGGVTGFTYPVFDETLVFDALKENAPYLRLVSYLPGMQYQNKVAVRVSGATSFNFTPAAGGDFGVGAQDAQGTLAFGNPSWTWHNLAGYVDLQIKLLDQSMMVMPTIMSEKDRDFANEMDKQVIDGGGGDAVTGILNVAGLDAQAVTGANGGDLTYGTISNMRATARSNNARLGGAVWLTDPVISEKARRIAPVTVTGTGVTGGQVATGAANSLLTIDGERVVVDTNVPADARKGSATNLRALLYGDPGTLIVGMFSEMEVLIDLFTQRGSGNVRVWCRQAWDMIPEQVDNFVVTRELLNAQTT